MSGPLAFSPELYYIVLLFALFVVPRVLQRCRLPAAVTSVMLGAVAGMAIGLFNGDATIQMLATLGIVSLFLFAGLEVDFAELRQHKTVLAQHLGLGLIMLFALAYLIHIALGLEARPAALAALALLTPSTGFILDSLPALGVTDRERFWVKSKAIATEIVALAVLFFALQSTTAASLTVSTLVLIALIAVLPLVFRAFAALVVPFAPKSEFAFLLMVAVIAAYFTRKLGVYYLVGAFIVGLTAQRFRERLPAMASERMLHAVEVFASFFVPFYFFSAGLRLRTEDFGPGSLLAGAGFLAIMVPLRVAVVAGHRRFALSEPFKAGMRVGASMLPTLVFTLVIAEILRDRFAVPHYVFGGLIVYALGTTLIPGFVLRLPVQEIEEPHAPALPNGAAEAGLS